MGLEVRILLAACIGAGFVFVGLGQIDALWGLLLVAGLFGLAYQPEVWSPPTRPSPPPEHPTLAKVINLAGLSVEEARRQAMIGHLDILRVLWARTGLELPAMITVAVFWDDGEESMRMIGAPGTEQRSEEFRLRLAELLTQEMNYRIVKIGAVGQSSSLN